jgi:cytochrome b
MLWNIALEIHLKGHINNSEGYIMVAALVSSLSSSVITGILVSHA